MLFNCPRCAKGLAFDSKLVGRELSCPSCKGRIVVPIPDASFGCSACGTELHARSDLAGKFECPACGNAIDVEQERPATEKGSSPHSMVFDCPFCGQSLRAPRERKGQAFRCPACERTSAVPDRSRPAPERKLDIRRAPSAPPDKARLAKARLWTAIAGGALLLVVFTWAVTAAIHRGKVSHAYDRALSEPLTTVFPELAVSNLLSVLSSYPDAPQAGAARDRTEEFLSRFYAAAFTQADQASDPAKAIKAIEGVMVKYPESSQLEVAKSRIARIKASKKRQDDAIAAVVADAKDCLGRGLPELAESRLDKALKENPWASQTTEAMSLLEQARTLLTAQRKAAAATEYRKRAKSSKPEEMVEFVKQCAELGIAEAERDLGWMHARGDGVPKNEREAGILFRKAAEQGDAEAEFWMGGLCLTGQMGVPADQREAVGWYRKAAEQGHAQAQLIYAGLLANGMGLEKDIDEAVRWLRRAAEQGLATAQAALATYYNHGLGVPKDFGECVKWARKAAEQGDAKGASVLGNLYALGQGVGRDDKEAVRWFRLAAEQGDAYAQNGLGVSYANGWGVKKDQTEAARWHLKAANQGHADSQYYLAVQYEFGRGIARDYSEAVRWYRMAAAQGQADAKQRLAILAAAVNQEANGANSADASAYSTCLRQSYEVCCRAYGEAELKPVRGNVALSNHQVGGFKVHVIYVDRIAEYLEFSKRNGAGESIPLSVDEKTLILKANSFGRSWLAGLGGILVLDTPETIFAVHEVGPMGFHICSKLGNEAKKVQLEEVRREVNEWGRSRGFR